MTGIAIDSSADILSVALIREAETYLLEIDAGLRHSERLMEAADSLFSLARADKASLDFVACMKGPGSFTGLRIGMSTAKGLSTALGIPLYAMPTMDCIAAARSAWPGVALPLIDAKQKRWYAAAFRGGKRAGPDMDAGVEELAAELRRIEAEKVLVCGPDAPRAAEILSSACRDMTFIVDPLYRSGAALSLALLAREKAERGEPGAEDGIGLDYLRKSEAELTRESKKQE